jgi:hypothetical protein
VEHRVYQQMLGEWGIDANGKLVEIGRDGGTGGGDGVVVPGPGTDR